MNWIKKNYFNIFVFVSLLFLTIFLPSKFLQSDTLAGIKVGELIFNHGFVKYDLFSIHSDLTFTFPHYLYDLYLYFVHLNFGVSGLYYFLIICFFTFLVFYYNSLRNLYESKEMALFFTAIIAILFTSFYALRAQSISYILFLLQIYSIEMFVKTNSKKYLFYLTGISLLIINNHVAVWPVYFIIYLPYFVNFFKIRLGRIESNKIINLRYLLLPFGVSFILPFCTRLGLEAYTYTYKSLTTREMMMLITEHQPISIATNQVFFLVVGLVVFMWVATNKRIRLKNFLFFLGFVLMGLTSIRHTSFIYLITPFIMLDYFVDNYKVTGGNIKVLNKMVILSVSLIVLFSFSKYIHNQKQEYLPKGRYPIKAVEYIKDNLDVSKIRLYNHYNVGGYLVYQDVKVFIDARCDLYAKNYSPNSTVLKDKAKLTKTPYVYQKIFAKYNLTHALVSKNELLNGFLKNDKKYIEIYSDKYFVLYEIVAEK